jgi:hypothetical protein
MNELPPRSPAEEWPGSLRTWNPISDLRERFRDLGCEPWSWSLFLCHELHGRRFSIPPAVLRREMGEVAASQLRDASLDESPRIWGLVVRRDQGFVVPLRTALSGAWSVHENLPFHAQQLKALLRQLLEAAGVAYKGIELDRLAFRIEGPSSGPIDGPSMDIAGLLSMLDAASGCTLPLLSGTCAVVQVTDPTGGQLGPVGAVESKLEAFEREREHGSLLIRHPDCKASEALRTRFDHVWEVRTLSELAQRLRRAQVLPKFFEWIERTEAFSPARVSPLMRLQWICLRLDRSNHVGNVESGLVEEAKALALRLRDDNDRECCEAMLRVAVSYTNGFEFEAAAECLKPWIDCDARSLTRMICGKLRSTAGQHYAFVGRLREARTEFREALRHFDQMSDKAEGLRNRQQTECYLAMASIDDSNMGADEARGEVEACLAGTVEVRTRELAAAPSESFRHQVLLRWLLQRGTATEREHYRGLEPSWCEPGDDFPWPAIELGRARILSETSMIRARDRALRAASLAFAQEQGPIVNFMGCVARLMAERWGAPWSAADRTAALDRLGPLLPGARTRIQLLRNGFESADFDPLQRPPDLLPFYFH